MSLTLSNKNQISEILNLVNLAYRGDRGWTRETDIVAGDRATKLEIERAIDKPGFHMLVYVKRNQLQSCICIEQVNEDAYIGLFAVDPAYQGKGLGKKVLGLAEEYASLVLGAKKCVMVVVSQRQELIAYYERRGYVRTGEVKNYPTDLDVGMPISKGLTIEYLRKSV